MCIANMQLPTCPRSGANVFRVRADLNLRDEQHRGRIGVKCPRCGNLCEYVFVNLIEIAAGDAAQPDWACLANGVCVSALARQMRISARQCAR